MGRSPVRGVLPKCQNGFIVSEVTSESEQVGGLILASTCAEQNSNLYRAITGQLRLKNTVKLEVVPVLN